MRSALMIDFNDSFTYNIVAFLSKRLKVEVVSFRHFAQNSQAYFSRFRYYVLGPGPGHPGDYPEMFSLVDCLLKERSFLHIRYLFRASAHRQDSWRKD